MQGLGLLTLSAIYPCLDASDCQTNIGKSRSSDTLQVILLFFALYLVALGQGGHKPCVQAFGADQFDGQNPEESKAKSSFFNWWYFFMCSGVFISLLVLTYIQDNLSWSLGFGIPCIVMICSLAIFWLGSRTYRYSIKREETNAFLRIGSVFAAAVRNWQITPPAVACEADGDGTLSRHSCEQFK